MRNLTLGDLSLGLANLLTERKPHIDACASGQLFGPMLTKKQNAIEVLPEALRGGKPLVEELAQVDDEHDGFGGGIYAYTEAILLVPSMSPELRAAAQRIREAFVPRKSLLSDSYAEEAATAKRNRSKLGERKTDLELFPTPDGKTLYDWALSFLDKGDAIDDLLNQRSLATVGHATRTTAAALRSDTLGLLYQFRTALRAEIADKSLDAALEEQVFSYFDELSSRRPSKKHPAKQEGVKPDATTSGETNG